MAAYNWGASYNGNVNNITGLKTNYTSGYLEVGIFQRSALCIKNGKFVAIMGPNGSEKSTLISIVGCLDRLTTVILKGRGASVIADDELEEFRYIEIGFVFQNFDLIPRPGNYEYVMLPVYSSTKKGVVSSTGTRGLLKFVGLDDHIAEKESETEQYVDKVVHIGDCSLNYN